MTINYSTPMNPFSMAYDMLCELMFSSLEMQELIKENNRVFLNVEEDRNPVKDAVSSADMPELIIVQDGGTYNLRNTSSSSQFNIDYSIVVNTGDMRVNKYTNRIQWAMVCNWLNWCSAMQSMLWHGETFVKRCAINSVSVGESASERQKSISGLTCVWKCTIEMHISTEFLVLNQAF